MRSYETDYYGWAEDTARAICNGEWSEIDRAALADEVTDLGRKIQNQMENRLIVLLLHLLKQRYQPQRVSHSWDMTILEQRSRAKQLLRKNPSLKAVLTELTADAYETARIRAAKETGLPVEEFPKTNPFTDEEIWG